MKKSLKNLLLSLMSICLVIGLLTGCGGSEEKTASEEPAVVEEKEKEEATDQASAETETEEETEQAEETEADLVEIDFMIPDWGAPTEEMLADFTNETGIKVNVIPTAWGDIRDKISTAAVGGTAAADVFEIDWAWIGEFHAADWLQPIEMDESDKEDFGPLDTFIIDGEVYAVPYANDFRVAYYNHIIFDEVGFESAPQTWDEVIEAGKALKDEGILEYPISIPMGAEEGTSTTFYWIAYTRNGKVFNDDGTLNEESTADALGVFKQLQDEGLTDPANMTSSGMDSYMRLTSRDAAFMVGPSSFTIRVNDEANSNVVDEVNPIVIPAVDGPTKATIPYTEAVGVSKYTEHPEEAKAFVKWYTSPGNQVAMYENLSTMPTRTSVLTDLVESGEIKNAEGMLESAKIVESPFPIGVPFYYTEMSTTIFNNINDMLVNDLSVEDTTAKMVEEVNTIVEMNR